MHTTNDLARFFSKMSHGDGCWMWRGAKNNKGYGSISWHGKQTLAHRVSYLIHYGSIPDGLLVLHRCDVPGCVNPLHLWVGTHGDNAWDKEFKGRGKHPAGEEHAYARDPSLHARGERSGRSKLKPEMIPDIRHLVSLGITKKELGQRYGVSAQSIGDIILGKSWTHIP